MEGFKELTDFYFKMKDDHRIGPVHISLYMAIFHLYQLNGFANPVPVNRALLMWIAKISGLATYHKYMRELAEFGYVKYEASYNPKVMSKIYLLGK